MVYEHKIHIVLYADDKLVEILNEWSLQGWEVISIAHGESYRKIYLRKPVLEPEAGINELLAKYGYQINPDLVKEVH